MKLFISPNDRNEEQTELVKSAIQKLESSSKHDFSLSREEAVRLFGSEERVLFNAEDSDIIVSFGGDGSVLRAAALAIQLDKPLIGINGGRLGYLCALSVSDIEDFDEKLEQYSSSERMLLELKYNGETYYALNDIIVGKRKFGGTADLILSVDEEENLEIRGDGIIFSTPTGSTAYNFSAKGPVLDLESSCYVLTPICPHVSLSNSIVVSEKRSVTVRERYDLANLYVDGREIGKMQGTAEIFCSNRKLRLYSYTGMKNRIKSLSI